MKTLVVTTCMVMFAVLQISNVMAKELVDYQVEAEKYYEAGDYKKAYKSYYKLAKIGDHKSQYWVATMNAQGEGRKVNLEDAYGWSYLAAESGNETAISKSEELLEQNSDKTAAEKRANKLIKKYGKEAQQARLERIAKMDAGRRAGSCVGSRLTCNRGRGVDPVFTYGSGASAPPTGSN